MNELDTEYKLNEIEQDIRPEDFPGDSFWYEFVRAHGPGPMIDLVKKSGGEKLYILNHDYATKGARRRQYCKEHNF